MTRVLDFTIAGVIITVAVVIHLIGIELVAPGTPLYELATDGTANVNGAERAELWSKILIVWVPLLASGGSIAWVFVREYRRQAATVARRP